MGESEPRFGFRKGNVHTEDLSESPNEVDLVFFQVEISNK